MKIKIEYLSIVISMVMVPIVLALVPEIHIEQLASGLRIYDKLTMDKIKSAVEVNTLNVYLGATLYNVPMLVLPKLNGYVTAIALVGVQRELLYNERSEFYYRSPYVRSDTLFTEYKQTEESIWERQGVSYEKELEIKGEILKTNEEIAPAKQEFEPETKYKRVCGITDKFEVFLANHVYSEIWVNEELEEEINADILNYEIQSFNKVAISMDDNNVYASAEGYDKNERVFLFIASFDITNGEIVWINREFVALAEEENREEYFLAIHASLEERDNTEVNDLALLKEYMKSNPHRQHGDHTYIQVLNDMITVETPEFLTFLSKVNGVEIISFILMKNAMLITNEKNELLSYIVDEEKLLISSINGDKFNEATVKMVQEITIIPGAEGDYNIEEALFAFYKTSLFTITCISSQNNVFGFNNNKLIWKKSLQGIKELSIHKIEQNLFIIIASSETECFILNSDNGEILGKFKLEQKPDNSVFESQNKLWGSVSIVRINPFLAEKSILIERGPFIDILSIRKGIKFNFWIEISIFLLICVFFYGILAEFIAFYAKKTE